MKQISKTEEPILGRSEVVYVIEKKATSPSRIELQKEIAKKEKAKPELVVVKNIDVQYGTNEFKVTALIYSNADDYKRLVSKALAKKSVIPVEEPKEEAKEEAPAEEAAPAEEEKKEEAA